MGVDSSYVETRRVFFFFSVEAPRKNSAVPCLSWSIEERTQTLIPTPGGVVRGGGQTLNRIFRQLGEVVGSQGPTSWLGTEACSVPGFSPHTVDTQLICQPERRRERDQKRHKGERMLVKNTPGVKVNLASKKDPGELPPRDSPAPLLAPGEL